MENKLPEHIQNKIFQESEDLYNKLDELAREYDHYNFGLPMFDKQKQPIIDLLTERYQQCQQLAEALKGILLFCETNGEPCDGYRFREEVQNARKLLATWNEGQAEKEPEPFTGSIFTSPAPGIAIGCISPEARDLLDTIMAKWEPHYQELKKNAPHVEITFYSLAYWLVRWSGLIQPAVKPEDTNKTE